MPASRSLAPYLLFLNLTAVPAAAGSAQVRLAVFSDRQLFWPQLAGQAPLPALGKAEPVSPVPRSKLSARDSGLSGPRGASGVSGVSGLIAVLPITVRDYAESLPCDSCHRLSANGMEFFLENYLKDKLAQRFPSHPVELMAPSQPLLATKLDLPVYLDSLALPWEKWLADSTELVYRPRDRAMGQAARQRLDKLGGLLGAAYLLLPARVRIHVTPRSSTSHRGGMEWGFALLLWNVAAGNPEWVLDYAEADPDMDLDAALDPRLDQGLGRAWDGLPKAMQALWSAEPK
jgi:hypothetical protein